MPYSEGYRNYVAYKAQTGRTMATGSGILLPTTGGQGGVLNKAAIASRIIRADSMQRRGRHGSQRTGGSYSGELSLGALDDPLEGMMRGTWSSSDLTITQSTTFGGSAALTSVTTTNNNIIASAGSWIQQGLRTGDVIRCSGLPDAANNGVNLRLVGVTASTLSFVPATGLAANFVANSTPDTTFSVVRPGRTLVNPAAGSEMKRYYTFEQHDYNVDASEVFPDCVWTRVRISLQADGMLNTEMAWVGTGQYLLKQGAQAPHFTSVSSAYLTTPLAAMEATLRLSGTGTILDLTTMDLTIERSTQTPSVTGPSTYAPDVFLGSLQVSGSLTFLYNDDQPLIDFKDENGLNLSLIAQENRPTNVDFFSTYLHNFTFGAVSKSEPSKDGGARTITARIDPALVGIDERGGAYYPGMISFQSSTAS